jgi:hypothetical protein
MLPSQDKMEARKMQSASSSTYQGLPSYLGLGTLDQRSVVTADGRTNANYLLGGEVLYRVSIGKEECSLEELLDGALYGTSTSSTLKQAFLGHFAVYLPYESERFRRLYHRVRDNRNIYLEFPGRHGIPQAALFPAGYVFTLRQPVVEQKLAEWNALKATIETQGDSAPLRVEKERKGAILRLTNARKVEAEQILVVDFSTILVNLVAATDCLWQSGLIAPGKEYRLEVREFSEFEQIKSALYLGDRERGVITYALVTARDGGKVDLRTETKAFRESSGQFLASLQRPD